MSKKYNDWKRALSPTSLQRFSYFDGLAFLVVTSTVLLRRAWNFYVLVALHGNFKQTNKQQEQTSHSHIPRYFLLVSNFSFRGNLSAPLYLDSSLSHHILTHPALKMIGAMSTLSIARHKTYRSHDLFMATLIILCRYFLIFWLGLFLRVLEMDASFFLFLNLWALSTVAVFWSKCQYQAVLS